MIATKNIIYLKFFADFDYHLSGYSLSIDKLKYLYESEIILTNDNNYTHAIIINTCMPELNIPKENVIGLAHEPNVFLFNSNNKLIFIEYAKKYISKYFLGDKEDLPEPFIEGNMFLSSNKRHYYYNPKNNFCSIVVSNKYNNNNNINYTYRHKLLHAILNTKLPIDIYGYCTNDYRHYNDGRVKHPLESTPDNVHGSIPFLNYKFHICIENTISNNYFSEKVINPLLSNNIPIYYGCKKIDNYFNINIKLTGNIDDDIKILTNVYENQEKYLIHNNKYEDILDKTDLLSHLHELFDNIKLSQDKINPN